MKFMRVLVAGLFLVSSGQAFALFDVSLMLGKRFGEFKNQEVGSTTTKAQGLDVKASAHVSPFPIPMVDIGFGLALTHTSWDKDDIVDAGSADTANGLDVALEVVVGLSLPAIPVEPYAKLAYNVHSALETEIKNETTGAKTTAVQTGSGYTVGLGLKYGLLPLISLMVEYSHYEGELDYDEYKVAGVEFTDLKPTDVSSDAFLLGVEVGL